VQAATFWKTVTMDRVDLLERALGILRESGVSFCVVGGQAVNAYVDPVVSPGSDLRVQLQTDPRYERFPQRAEIRNVLGHQLPVARLEDVLQGKVWAAGDETRRPSKRQKDLADIARLLEAFPELRASVPAAILARLIG
jgi:hypothetical protein